MSKGKIKNILITLTYIVLVGVLILLGFDLNNKYNKEEMMMVEEVENLINNAVLNNNNDKRMEEIILNARDDYTFDVVITRDDEVLLSTIPYVVGDTLQYRANDKVMSKVENITVEKNFERMDVWYSIYRLSDRVYIQSYLQSIIMIVSILTLLVTLTIILISNRLFKPLRNIKKSIEFASNYDFDQIESSDDEINLQFKSFVSRLQDDISAVTRQHTELEKEIQANRKHLNNTVAVSRSMIHDIKTPVHRNLLENERYEELYSNEEAILELTQLNENLNHQIMLDLNSILKMLRVDYEKVDAKKTNVNLTEKINHSLSIFNREARRRGVSLNFNVDKDYELKTVESSLILMINTLLLVLLTYSNKESILETTLKYEGDVLVLTMENETTEDNKQKLLSTEQLFNERNTDIDSGLYLVRELVLMLDGKYIAYDYPGGVKVEVIFNDEKNSQ